MLNLYFDSGRKLQVIRTYTEFSVSSILTQLPASIF